MSEMDDIIAVPASNGVDDTLNKKKRPIGNYECTNSPISSKPLKRKYDSQQISNLENILFNDVEIRDNILSPFPHTKIDEVEQENCLEDENNNNEVTNTDMSFVFEEYDMLFIAQLPSYEHVLSLLQTPIKICLPPKLKNETRKTLVLDLDETLIHCNIDIVEDFDWKFTVNFNNTAYEVMVKKRPNLIQFLNEVSKLYEIIIFTASQQTYAQQVIDKIDPTNKLIQHRLYRDSCLYVNGNFLKDLTVLGRDLKDTIIIDNSPHAYAYQVDNGIPIRSWFNDKDDNCLMNLLPLLKLLSNNSITDVRNILRKKYNMKQRHIEIKRRYQYHLKQTKQQ